MALSARLTKSLSVKNVYQGPEGPAATSIKRRRSKHSPHHKKDAKKKKVDSKFGAMTLPHPNKKNLDLRRSRIEYLTTDQVRLKIIICEVINCQIMNFITMKSYENTIFMFLALPSSHKRFYFILYLFFFAMFTLIIHCYTLYYKILGINFIIRQNLFCYIAFKT